MTNIVIIFVYQYFIIVKTLIKMQEILLMTAGIVVVFGLVILPYVKVTIGGK